jgi:hypothetical protein
MDATRIVFLKEKVLSVWKNGLRTYMPDGKQNKQKSIVMF